MTRAQVESALKAIFRDVFGIEDDTLLGVESLFELEQWDSLNQVRLSAAIDSEFGIALSSEDTVNLANFQKTVDLILERL